LRKIVLAALLLAGCVSTGKMDALRGQSVEQAFARLGYPDSKMVVLGDTVYSWGTDQPHGPSCVIKVVVGPDNIVKSWNAYGNAVGCNSRIN